MNTKKSKVRLWSVLTALTAILTIAAIVGNMIANQYATTLNVALNASTYKIIKGNTTEDTEYFKAGFASDEEREAYEAELCATVEAEGAAHQKTDTAPLPLAVRQKNGFRGPRENTPRLDTKQYYRDCEISGNIEFIFGGANAVFDHCRIVPVAHRGVTSYIAAASTPQGKPGYLIATCTVQGNSPAGSVYLGRPWRQYARVYWLDCDLSDEIIPLGWDNWSDPANEETVHFGEYGSKGPGAPKASPARAGYAALNDEASAQEVRAMLAEFRADFGAEA